VCSHPRDAEAIDFDDGNETELAGHGITALEVWELVTNDPAWVPNKKGRAGMWLAVGRTAGGRALTVPVAYDEILRVVRPITGWNSTTGEQARYL